MSRQISNGELAVLKYIKSTMYVSRILIDKNFTNIVMNFGDGFTLRPKIQRIKIGGSTNEYTSVYNLTVVNGKNQTPAMEWYVDKLTARKDGHIEFDLDTTSSDDLCSEYTSIISDNISKTQIDNIIDEMASLLHITNDGLFYDLVVKHLRGDLEASFNVITILESIKDVLDFKTVIFFEKHSKYLLYSKEAYAPDGFNDFRTKVIDYMLKPDINIDAIFPNYQNILLTR